MTLILNGTDNSATTPAVTGTDTDTGVYYPAANQVALATNGTLALLVDSSQNVTLGTTAQNFTLQQNTASGTNSTSYPGYIAFTGFGWNTALGSSPLGVRLAAGGNYTPDLGNVAPGLSISTQNTNGSMTQRMLLNGFGIGLGTGTYPISGTGIKFPATQDASSNANTLDDYEEGTWTVSDASGAGLTINQSGVNYYTKIGRIVYISFYVTYPANSNSNTAQLSLPFNSDNAGSYGYLVGRAQNNISNGPITWQIGGGNSYANASSQNNSSPGTITNAQLSGSYLLYSGWYTASA